MAWPEQHTNEEPWGYKKRERKKVRWIFVMPRQDKKKIRTPSLHDLSLFRVSLSLSVSIPANWRLWLGGNGQGMNTPDWGLHSRSSLLDVFFVLFCIYVLGRKSSLWIKGHLSFVRSNSEKYVLRFLFSSIPPQREEEEERAIKKKLQKRDFFPNFTCLIFGITYLGGNNERGLEKQQIILTSTTQWTKATSKLSL